MANSPVSLILPQYDIDDAPAAGYYLKGYQAGTTTPITMYTDAAGSSSLAKAALDANGFPITSGNVKFTPHFAEAFDLWLFPDATSADANDTSSATQITDSGIIFLRDPVNVKLYGATGNGTTDDSAALIASIAAISSDETLFWPNGTYNTTSSITNLHTRRHLGGGAIKRGSDIFYVDPQLNQTNTLYVNESTGNDGNDGITASQPFETIQAAFNVYARYANSLGSWTIKLSGNFTEGGVVTHIRNSTELIVEGELLAGVPNVIIDGTTSSLVSGLNFNEMNQVRVKYVKVQNWSGVGSGIVFQNGTKGVCDTCDCEDNAEANFNCSEFSEMVLIGTINSDGSKQGLRYYGNSTGSVGDGTNTVTIDGATQSGIVVRDGSKVVTNNNFVVQNCSSTAVTAGVHVIKDGYCELRTCTIQNNSIGAYVENNSIIDTQTGTRTFTGNTQDYRIKDGSKDRSFFSTSSDVAETWTPRSSPSGDSPNSNYDLVVDYDGATGMQWLSNGNNINIDFDKLSRISHVSSDNSLRFTADNVDVIRLDGTPGSTNTGMLLLVNNGVTTALKTVEVGAADSGGSGFRILRVAN